MAPQQPSSARDQVRDIVPALVDLSERVLFGEVWERPGLSKRDRSLITCATLIALGREKQLVGHLQRALDNGLKQSELSEVSGIVGLIYKRLRWGCARGDLVLRFGREIAGVMSFVQLFFKRPAGSVDYPPAFDGQALADFFRPARQVFIFVRL
jgi:4-carboxymuconolactone decarboxylase